MSEPYVSSYDQVFRDAFDKGIKEMPQDLSGLVKTIVDKLHEDVLSNLNYYIVDEMKSNIDREIQDHASKVASSMLANALAGDDREIRNLFGFNDWYMKHSYVNEHNKPTQWALIDAITARRPDLFVSERIAQRDVEIVKLNQRIANLNRQLDYMKNGDTASE